MGIRFYCEHCHQQLNVKAYQAGEEGVCPLCEQPIKVPEKSTVLSKAEAARKKRKKAERRARRKAIEDDQKTVANLSATSEFDDISSPHSTHIKTTTQNAVSPRQQTSNPAATGAADLAPNQIDGKETQGSFLLDKPENPWLSPNAPDALESGLNKVWYVRHPKQGEKGPIKGKEIANMLNDRQIVAGCFLWREDWEDWIRAELIFRDLVPKGVEVGDQRLFSDPNASVPRSYQKKALAEANAKKRKLVIGIVAVILGIATIGLLIWLLTTMW